MTTSASAAPERPIRPTLIGRLWDFTLARFPPATLVPAALANFAAVHFALQAGASDAPLRVDLRFIGGALSALLLMLLMRVYDELKDVQTDLALGRAGDPVFSQRPIVTGHIRLEDIIALRWGVTAVLVGINAALGFPRPFGVFAIVFVVMWLSFRWFFVPAISKNVLLAFVTHNPISLCLSWYVYELYATSGAGSPSSSVALAAMFASWLPIAGWELSRKIRAPQDETNYDTYSKRLGWKWAPFVAGGVFVASGLVQAWLGHALGLPLLYVVVAVGTAVSVVAGCLRFRLNPTTQTSKLLPLAEGHAFVATVGMVVAIVWLRGVVWTG